MQQKLTQKIIFIFLLLCSGAALAQTDMDAIMMPKQNFCGGFTFTQSSWKNYWEGTFKRDNQNIGTVSTSMIALMGNYGISDKLNVLFGLPYVQTKASEGTLTGLKGIQDLSITVKYMPVEKDLWNGTFSLYAIGGISLPVTNYAADYLPLSIGLHSSTATLRVMLDYQWQHLFVTASGAYIARKNISIDRTAYYTTEMHYSNEVSMPDALNYNVRLGYRSERLIVEATFDNFITQGGFDIRKNDMPFPSNKMNASKVGVSGKYTLKKPAGLAFIAGANYVIAGRNIGQSTTFDAGVYYQMNWGSSKKKEKNKSKDQAK